MMIVSNGIMIAHSVAHSLSYSHVLYSTDSQVFLSGRNQKLGWSAGISSCVVCSGDVFFFIAMEFSPFDKKTQICNQLVKDL